MVTKFSVMLTLAALAISAQTGGTQSRYRHPIVFCSGEMDENTGKPIFHSKIWVMEEDGSGLRQLTQGPSYDDHPSLYSDLHTVLYSEFAANDFSPGKGARLMKLDLYTGAKEAYAEAPGCALHHASLTFPGDLLAYHRDCGRRRSQWVGWGPDAYEVNTRSTNGVALPDGIIFMHEKNSGLPEREREVSLARMYGHGPGARVVFLTDDKVLHRRPAISPDRKLMAWQTNAAGKEDEIFIANIDGTNARNLTDRPGNDGHPWFSRDGKTIVFESDASGQWDIWKVDLQTRKITQLTFGGKKYVSTRPRM